MGEVFESGFCVFCAPTAHVAADTEVYAVEEESPQLLVVIHATIS